jgi:putative Holliday junction resolvase
MRYLGIDFGSKRIGISLSDSSGRMAFPHSIVQNTSTAKDEILALMKKENVGVIVAGDSRNRDGIENPIMQKAKPFCEALAVESGAPLYYRLEAYTSVQAAHIQGDNAMNDASAATLILQSYLDGVNPSYSGSDGNGDPDEEVDY